MSNLKPYKNFLEKSKLQPGTVKTYLWHLQQFFNWLVDKKLTAENLKKYYPYLLRKYKKIATINLRLITLNNYLKFSKHKFRFDLLTAEKQLLTILTKKQLTDFLNTPLGKTNLLHLRDKALLELLYYTGLKPGQLVKLKIDDLNLAKNILRFNNKNLLFPEVSKICLLKYLNKRIDNSSWLFVNLDRAKKSLDNQLSVRSVERILEKYSRRLQPILQITPQVLRNTLAHYLKVDGGSPATIQDSLHFQTKVGAENYYKKL